jgi:hypothetical protein
LNVISYGEVGSDKPEVRVVLEPSEKANHTKGTPQGRSAAVRIGLEAARASGEKLGRQPVLREEDRVIAFTLLAQGKPYRQVADALGVSIGTISNLVASGESLNGEDPLWKLKAKVEECRRMIAESGPTRSLTELLASRQRAYDRLEAMIQAPSARKRKTKQRGRRR